MYRRTLLALAAVALLLPVLPGCSTPPGRTGSLGRQVSVDDAALAERAREAEAAGRRDEAIQLWEELVSARPGSEHAPEAWRAIAEDADDRGRFAQAARAWTEYHEVAPEGPARARARERLRTLVEERLDDGELAAFAREQPDGVAASYAAWVLLQRGQEGEAPPETQAQRARDFLDRWPESRYAPEVALLLDGLPVEDTGRDPGRTGLVRDDHIGLVLPLSGDYADLGQAVYDGALLALEEHNRAFGDGFTLVASDSRGDEVEAVMAGRSLLERDGAIAIVGALLSPETVSLAVLCQERGVPMVSPTATKESISGLGEWVFQANLTRAVEAGLLASASAGLLLRTEAAVLYPEGEEGERSAELFARELERRGGRVLAAVGYPRGTTDFREPIQRLRAVAPEVLYIPASYTDMRLIAPQLVFHDLQAQLLGPSSWNSPGLVREVGADMDRAIFPSDLALIPEAEKQRFSELWRRKHGQRPSSDFALKGWFSMRAIVEALAGGARDREALREELAGRFATGVGGAGIERLRILDAGSIKPLPAELFPQAGAGFSPARPADRDR